MKAFTIAASNSGCGKTVLTCAALQALRDRGLVPAAFKCGPDFIDPLFHREILGVASCNLDLFFTDPSMTRELFRRERGADAAVVEGVMGLFDGADVRSDKGSTYDVARTLGIPVVLIVDGRGAGRSLIASIRGFVEEDKEGRIAGIILNRVSETAYQRVKPVIEETLGVRLFGYMPKLVGEPIESRYLGLRLPHEIADLKARIREAAAELARHVDLDAILAAAAEVTTTPEPSLTSDVASAASSSSSGAVIPASCVEGADALSNEPDAREPVPCAVVRSPRIAVALDEAFCFYYEENLRLLREFGAELVFFSPLHDAAIPADVDGLLLGGGYPELHLPTLSTNASMLTSIREAFRRGIPTLAECGGFMYLHDAILGEDGTRYPCVGAIPGACRNAGRLVRFGYLSIEEKFPRFMASSDAQGQGTEGRFSLRGHEFHYYDSENNGGDCVSTKPSTGRSWDSGHVASGRWLGFAHLYYLSNPDFPKAFVERCMQWRESRADAGASDVAAESLTVGNEETTAAEAIAETKVGKASDALNGAFSEASFGVPACSASDAGAIRQGSDVPQGAAAPEDSHRFFSNTACKYYPCHDSPTPLNCLFCFCPMYTLPNCPGKPQFKEKNGRIIKRCAGCDFPHRPENYDAVMQNLRTPRIPDAPDESAGGTGEKSAGGK